MAKLFFRRRKVDPFSGENAPKIDYKDTRFLKRYISERGKIAPVKFTNFRKGLERARTIAQLLEKIAVVLSSMPRSDDQKPSRVIMPPGGTALKVLRFVFTKKAFENVFAQTIADMREEHAEALYNREFGKARWIVIRDHLGIILTVAVYLASAIGKKLLGIWKIIP